MFLESPRPLETPPGMVRVRDAFGHEFFAPATPEALSAQHTHDVQAGMSGAGAKGDNATVSDFLASTSERTARAFYLWCTCQQVTPRHAMALELQARSAGVPFEEEDATFPAMRPRAEAHTFHPSTMAKSPPPHQADESMRGPHSDEDEDTEGHTFHPTTTMAEGSEPDPLKRLMRPLHDPDDLDYLAISGGATLAQLRAMGLVDESMSQEQFDARLRRLKMGAAERMYLAAQGYEQGMFQADAYYAANRLGYQMAPDRLAQQVPYSAPNSVTGDTLQRGNDNPMKGYTTRNQIVNQIQASCEQIKTLLHRSDEPKPTGRTIRATREGC